MRNFIWVVGGKWWWFVVLVTRKKLRHGFGVFFGEKCFNVLKG